MERNSIEFNPSSDKEINYKDFLEVRIVETSKERKHSWRFSVSENFTIFITSEMHSNLSDNYGVDSDRTLTEGYIHFNEDGSIKIIRFKTHPYQPFPGFKSKPQDLLNLKNSVRELIEESLSKNN